MKTKIAAEYETKEKQLLDIMFERANITGDMLIKDAVARWINKNLDLLNESELKTYQDVISVNTIKNGAKRK